YGNNIYNIGNSTKTSIEGGSVVGGIYIESGTVESGKARGTVLDGLNVAAGTVRIGAYTTATDITVTSGNIYVANDNGDVKCAASGITLGSGKLYLGYNSKAQQVNMDLSTGELWLQKADTQDPPLNTTYFNKYEGVLNNIFNLKVINGVLQTPEVRLGTIAAAFTDSTHILLTITGSDHAPSTKSEVTVGSVLIVPDTWNQDALTSTTYTCTAVLGSAGCGFTEVNAITDSGYFNVYITISAATISTSIATSSIPASVHPSAGEGESYVDTGTYLSRSFVKMYQSDKNSTPSATNLELPILTDSAVKANFRGWDDDCASYLYDGVSLNIPYSLPAGGKVMITALWLNGNILNDYGIYYEYDSETKILTVAYDPDKKVGSVEPSPIMNATDAETLRTALGDDLQKVRKLVVTAITVLPGSAFSGYVSLSDVTLTGSGMGYLTNIGPSVFKGCSPNLKINLYDMDPSFTPILNLDILENSLLEAYRSTSIMLLDDIELTSTLNIGADTVMNLNGKTLSITSGYAFSLGSGVSITIADINPYGSGTVSIGANSYHVGSLYNTAEDSSHAKSSSVTLFAEDPVRAAKAEQIGSAGSTVMLIDAADRVEHKTYIGWSEEAQDTVPDCSDQSPIVLGSSGTTKNLYGVYRTTAFRASFTE
ncbi:MAG: hypothetical protein IJT54_06555, partial [Candidatus Methanomethylophilaceae archaeon]|nr:hypothetical protein [Candidatus Methanomethylophilaceae archaeon]